MTSDTVRILWTDGAGENPKYALTRGPAVYDVTHEGQDTWATLLDPEHGDCLVLSPEFGHELITLCYALGMPEIEAQTSDEDQIDFLMRQVASALDFLQTRR